MSEKILKAEVFSKEDLQALDTVTITINLDDSNYKASTVNIGSVSSGATPSVTNVGTERDALLNFVLPEGKVGPKGDNGDSATIQIGSVTTGSTPQVVNVGTERDAILNFTLPEGRPGLQGTTGEKGLDGKDGLDGKSTTIKIGNVVEGTSAKVVNVGTPSEVILDFTLPVTSKAKSTVMSDNTSITIDNTLVNKIIGCTSINDVTIDLTNMTTGDILSVMNIGFKKNISFTGKTIIGQNNFTGEKGSTASIMIFNEEAYININLADNE